MRNIFIRLTALLFISCNSSLSENVKTFNLLSFENSKNSIEVKKNFINGELKFILKGKDSVCFENFIDLTEEIKISEDKFMCIEFSVRGGTGVKTRMYVELCISNNKIHIPINAYSIQSSFLNQAYNKHIDSIRVFDEKRLNTLMFERFDNTTKEFQLKVFENFIYTSKYDSSKNVEIKNTSLLNFDPIQMIFYNQLDTLFGVYSFSDNNGYRDREFFSEIVHAIKFYGNEYYFIDRNWHLKEKNNIFLKLSNICE